MAAPLGPAAALPVPTPGHKCACPPLRLHSSIAQGLQATNNSNKATSSGKGSALLLHPRLHPSRLLPRVHLGRVVHLNSYTSHSCSITAFRPPAATPAPLAQSPALRAPPAAPHLSGSPDGLWRRLQASETLSILPQCGIGSSQHAPARPALWPGRPASPWLPRLCQHAEREWQ